MEHRISLGHCADWAAADAHGRRGRDMSPALPPTAGQTVGPFFGYALPYDRDSELVPPGHPRAVRLYGRVIDGAAQPVPDALLELWQVDEAGFVGQEGGSLRGGG